MLLQYSQKKKTPKETSEKILGASSGQILKYFGDTPREQLRQNREKCQKKSQLKLHEKSRKNV